MLNGSYVWEVAKTIDDSYQHFLDTRAKYDYTKHSSNNHKEYRRIKRGAFNQIESITGGPVPSSRRYVLYNMLNPDPQFRMRTYQMWQSDWVKSITWHQLHHLQQQLIQHTNSLSHMANPTLVEPV
ncbi:unnamed protein product [Ambrosiozyma monospora]|uniref:Unnamed protein product n=1 Tax=Ambrosiozyma monospora TaxID=43982 RepID=A0ACB5UCA0_AMBMO|nr:unnamed protein product [Ambrosiozyma monospora]